MKERIDGVVDVLQQIEQDFSVPKNVRARVKDAIVVLNDDNEAYPVRINRAIDELTDVSDDSNLPIYTRTQIWNIVSILESTG